MRPGGGGRLVGRSRGARTSNFHTSSYEALRHTWGPGDATAGGPVSAWSGEVGRVRGEVGRTTGVRESRLTTLAEGGREGGEDDRRAQCESAVRPQCRHASAYV
jgi:hypothetical protein